MTLQFSDTSTTKMTSKGQVVIPEAIREFMELESGAKFVVLAIDDSIIFKKIQPIPEKDIQELLKASRKLAKEYGFKKSDISKTIKKVRAEKTKQAEKLNKNK